MNKAPLVVNVTGAAPTGQVFNSGSDGLSWSTTGKGHSGPSVFLFDTENGTIDGWNPAVGAYQGGNPSTVTEVALRTMGPTPCTKAWLWPRLSDGKTYLYATNFRSGRVEAYDSTFKPVELPGGLFVDPRLPAGYGPFGIAEIKGNSVCDVRQAGRHAARRCRREGPRIRRRLHQQRRVRPPLVTRGALDSPWGLTLAPRRFRPVQRGSARGQLRQRAHQCLQPGNRQALWASCGGITASRSSSMGSGA